MAELDLVRARSLACATGTIPTTIGVGAQSLYAGDVCPSLRSQTDHPNNRGHLFATFVSTLLAREEERSGPERWPDAESLCQALADLAYAMQETGERGTAVNATWAMNQLPERPNAPREVLYLAASATLLEWRDDTVRFVHQLLQEYFAALALQGKWEAAIDLSKFWPQGWLEPSDWDETFMLLAGMVPEMTPLVADLLSVNPKLTARCIAGSGGAPPSPEIFQQVQETLVALATSEDVDVRHRNAAGDALNDVDDSRPGVGLTAEDLPDILWCTVPEGMFLMGNTKETDEMAFGNEAPQHEVHLATFAISKYPITNAQYRAFVRDGGYIEEWRHCWTQGGWQWRTQRNRIGPKTYGGTFDLANHPVVGVTLYEAVAFCNWLSAKLERPITLPSEAQWEKAARGTDGRHYPWGPALTPEHANYADTGLDSTSCVGIFPRARVPMSCLIWLAMYLNGQAVCIEITQISLTMVAKISLRWGVVWFVAVRLTMIVTSCVVLVATAATLTSVAAVSVFVFCPPAFETLVAGCLWTCARKGVHYSGVKDSTSCG